MKRLAATFLCIAAAYTLTLPASQSAASADLRCGVVTTSSSALLSPSTAALADGDDIRARALVASQH
jgi:hypothetical protein